MYMCARVKTAGIEEEEMILSTTSTFELISINNSLSNPL